MHETLRVDKHDGACRGGLVQAGLDHRQADQPRDPDPGRAGAGEHDPGLVERRPERPKRGQDPRHDDRGGALDVVVEGGHAVLVPIEDPQRVGLLEVLPLDDATGPHLGNPVTNASTSSS